MGKQGENKHGNPIFLFLFLNLLYMAGICAKFEKHLDMTSFPRDRNYLKLHSILLIS